MKYILSLSSKQHKELQVHLLQKDGLESIALIFCHRGAGNNQTKLVAFKIAFIPDDECERSATNIIWNTEKHLSPEVIQEMDNDGLCLMTIHSHLDGFDDDSPSGATVMLPNGNIFARIIDRKDRFILFSHVSIAGSEINVSHGKDK